MRSVITAFTAILFFGTMIKAQSPTYGFLQTDASARTAALQGSFISIKDDPNGIFYNPALTGTLVMPRISFTYLDHWMDVNSGTLSFGYPVKGIGNIGVGIIYMSYGSFQRTDESLNVLGTFDAGDLALTAGTAFNYSDDVLIGFNVKYIHSSIAEFTSYALAVDIGLLYDLPEENLTIGASLMNVGEQFKTYGGTREPLPRDLSIGLTKKPQHLPVILNIVLHRLNESEEKFLNRFSKFTFGAEFLMSESIRFRLGYNNKQRKDMKMGTSYGLAGFSLGFGIILQEYQVDYSYSSITKNTDGLHRFSLGINL
jgi:hypothetical protein